MLRLSIPVLLIAGGLSLLSAAPMLDSGTAAPEFSLKTGSGDTVALSHYRGKKQVVLVFYPGDNTPGCTDQLCELRDNLDSLSEAGAVVLGINNGSQKSHRAFRQEYGFQFPLLVDTDRTVAEEYGAASFFGI
ncbi:MAG: peroxiredoxin, partial [Fibrobacterota bacterium]